VATNIEKGPTRLAVAFQHSGARHAGVHPVLEEPHIVVGGRVRVILVRQGFLSG